MSSSPAPTRLDVLAIEPWNGGSHRQFLDQWVARSVHAVRVAGLAPRQWKWRMRSAAWQIARDLPATPRPDVILASDYVDLPALYGWLPDRWGAVPAVLYFHENQLVYPSRPGAEEPAERDMHYGFTNALSCVRAERVVFNSGFHRSEFSAAAEALLTRLPSPGPRSELRSALDEALVIPPGVDLDEIPLGAGARAGAPLRVAFNHRWEHDKDPAAFLRAAVAVPELEVVLLGERFEEVPSEAASLLSELEPRVRHAGFARSRADYAALLGECDIVVSTALQEYFGMAVVEGMAAGCTPLLPNRLSYPDLLPGGLSEHCLYKGERQLIAALRDRAIAPSHLRTEAVREGNRRAASPFDAGTTASLLDELCHSVAFGAV